VTLGTNGQANAPNNRAPTLDHLFRRTVERHGNALALIDPPDRAIFTDGVPKQLSYAEADAAVSAMATRLRNLGLPDGSVVAIQLPNIVEGVVALLGALRAGLIAALLPLHWRHAEMVEALQRSGACVLITCRRVGATDHAHLAMRVAADTLAIRHLCTFGRDVPDGAVGLDDIFTWRTQPSEAAEAGRSAGSLAVTTFALGSAGIMPVVRSHTELIAGGLAVVIATRLNAKATILGALLTASFAGLATVILPWLICGGTLMLHQPFDAEGLAAQANHCHLVIVPGPLASPLAAAGLIGRSSRQTVVALWRSPERTAAAEAWKAPAVLTDILALGEIGLVPARRDDEGRPNLISAGAFVAPRNGEPRSVLVDIARTPSGTLALSGAMVPRYPLPPEAELHRTSEGFIDTGYPCRGDQTGTLRIEGPPRHEGGADASRATSSGAMARV
jgi:hypothetical protein